MASHIAITPAGHLDSKIAIAACRAGDIGILDLGCQHDPEATRAAIQGLAASAGPNAQWGIRWDTLGSAQRGLEQLAEFIPHRVPILVLAGLKPDDLVFTGMQPKELAALKKKIKRLARKIFVEVWDLPSALAAEASGCDGLILKGHESGGWVSRHSSFILLQELHGRVNIPYWVQGGMGTHTAAAAVLAGATGVVLCEQLWLADESPFVGTPQARAWAALDGSETVLIGPEQRLFRLFGRGARERLDELEQAVIKDGPWEELLLQSLAQEDAQLVPIGEDVALAAALARRHGTVGRILAAVSACTERALREARAQQALGPDSPLAQLHGTRYPIVQGPMTRVSDVDGFAKAVADGGGLPFIALSVMRQDQVQTLLTKTKELLGDQPWGVGILGFMPLELRQAQLEVVRQVKPRFALIAGGRPGQARELEAIGISTYLHVPSPGLLKGFIKDGARKFIFEGGECGGHTGPLSSFILWESAIETLTSVEIADPESIQVLFAGGIHDELSAAMVSALAAPLVERGMKIGVIMGTAYLFTHEIVNSGAILPEFQSQAIACKETTLLQSGKGMYTRCAVTPFCEEFNRTRRDMLLALESPEKVLKVLELFNIGRLRMASKGISQNPDRSAASRYVQIPIEDQRREGMYMLGEVARLRSRVLSIAELHSAVSAGCGGVLAQAEQRLPRKRVAKRVAAESDIAIVGMAGLLPGASDLRTYWQNILHRVNAIREVSEERWRPEDFFDPKRGTPDKVYSKWGGFMDDIQFDPSLYGIPPASLRSIEPVQLLALDVVRHALADAGFDRRSFANDRTATIFAAGGMNELGCDYIFRGLLSHYLPRVEGLPEAAAKQLMEALYEQDLPKWTEDSFPGILENVIAGRVANRFDLRGTNFVVDAACASSLAALDAGIRQLRSHDADVAVVGAIDATNNPIGYLCFAQTHALSPRGRSRPFDDSADGIALGEGVVSLVLKRLGDAERDGDRIYAVIKGIGASSDGRNRSLTAPHPQGQLTALQRAYEDAAVDPTSIGLIEAHGTGTALGDKSEIESLNLAFGKSGMATQSCAVGSVKSMIGHTKVAAGLAAMVKTALALKHRVLPPTIGVEVPNSKIDFGRSPFFINTEARPWLNATDHPRRAGVSAFGFGGTNFHVVLEEYAGAYRDSDAVDLYPRDAEPFTFRGQDRAQVREQVQRLLDALEHPEQIDVAQLAYALHLEQGAARAGEGARLCRLALVASSTVDLKAKLELALKALQGRESEVKYPQGVFFREGPETDGGVCFVFPGQGSQRLNMLSDLTTSLPELHGLFERADALLADRLEQPLSRYIYPAPVFSDEERSRQQTALNATQVAQPALGVVDSAALRVLGEYGLKPDFVAGHSYGEYVALHAAGVIGLDDFIRLSEVRGRLAGEAGRRNPGAMAAIDADEARVRALIEQHGLNVTLANLNAADQTIVAGSVEAIEDAAKVLGNESLRVKVLPVSAAFHSPAMAGAREGLAAELAKIEFKPAQVPVFSNTTGSAYPEDPEAMRALLVEHMTEPVHFVKEINQLYEAGARVFVEAGPGLVLTGLVDRILGDRPHTALGIEAPGRGGWVQLAHVFGQLFALGLPLDFGRWFKGRGYEVLTVVEVFARAKTRAVPGPLIWRVNGARAVPWNAPAKARPAIASIQIATEPKAPVAAPTAMPATAPRPQGQTAASVSTVAHVSFARPAITPVNVNRQAPQRRYSMANDNTLRTGDLPAEMAAPSLLHAAHVQEVIAQFIALQRDQQDTLRRFLDFQSSLAGADLASFGEPRATLQVVSQAGLAPAPAPVLPAQVLSLHAAALPVGRVPQATIEGSIQRGEVPAEAPKLSVAASAPAAAAPVAKAVAPAGQASTEAFKADLLQAVSERTGYPEDMLDLDAHMEADLGIDSIKRIEVLSQLKDRHNLMAGRDEEAMFEELTGLKTLNEIVVWYDKLHNSSTAGDGAHASKKALTPLSASPAETAESVTEVAPEQVVHCYTVKAVAAPLGAVAGPQPAAGLPVLLVGADSELATAFRAALGQAGQQVKQIVPGKENRALGDERFEFDPASLESVQALRDLLGEVRIGTLVSLLGVPTGEGESIAPAKVLFLLCKVFDQDLKAATGAGAGWLLSVTALDGRFGLEHSRELPIESAGTLGVTKSASREWGDEVHVKCIDVSPALAADAVVESVLGEWAARVPALEVGYGPEGRCQLELGLQAPQAAAGLPALEEGAVVLITGGAGGITAEIASALGREYRPQLVLLGRSPLPEEEAEDTRGIADPAKLKQVLIGKLRGEGGTKLKPAEVDRVFKRLLKDREIRGNLARLEATGAKVEYHAVDVRDGEAFGRLIDGIYAKWGRIDGVLHGAGVIDDKLIRDKTLESFSSVYDTKVAGARVLASRLRPEGLKFVLFFSSIAGRFGNAGQTDYSAANEVLNKLADSLGHRWPGVHALAIDWGPWKSGMVGDQMLRFYAERNIHPIPLDVGTRHCLEQLRRGNSGETELVITASLEQILEQMQPRKRRDQDQDRQA
ncbi:SDR family NAD(P)-dependent oxidoreductase [Azotobacter beijerinckii]|uniref:SDR family NAD(P)-dependent oxidoreductase n=1 Tax=Azotobacter beijerinckii TaxID=170623 RepID=UPI002954620C|nr:SDR family NAD(P)-dependent oxidoreductase [Azotobacter beijerinckii]MDV7210010.1 SDR family NAD(P)-dependent oxidoreductase [Azotobacter beijerinckii]